MNKRMTIISSLLIQSLLSATANDGKKGKENHDLDPLTPKTESYYTLNYNVKKDLLAVQGYSIVSYIEKGIAEKGMVEFQVNYDNINYNFVSQEQVDLFKANQKKYLPKYGGYCAFGVLIDTRLDANPKNFKIINGETYLYLKNEKMDALEAWNHKGHESKKINETDAKWAVLKFLL